jgi:hypothetical protein
VRKKQCDVFPWYIKKREKEERGEEERVREREKEKIIAVAIPNLDGESSFWAE